MTIRILVTGGTFDKEYDELGGKLFFKNTHLHEMLMLGRAKVQVEIQVLMLMDSLEMSETERRVILESCLRCPEHRIVITHGTDTMEETARVLGPAVGDRTVVLTGAMVPYKFGSSDGLFNLGSALALAQTLPPGVYIAMNGRYFHWDNVRKNRKTAEFEEINSRPTNS
jgi:L-asparaginase